MSTMVPEVRSSCTATSMWRAVRFSRPRFCIASANGPIVIDLGDVYFIDSSGFRSLLSASRRARARKSDVVLRNIGSEVLRLLEITGTTEHFSIETSRE